MKKKFEEIFEQLIFNQYHSILDGFYCYACSINHFVNTRKFLPLSENCNGERNLGFCRNWNQIPKMQRHFIRMEEEEMVDYINMLISGSIPGQKLPDEIFDLFCKQVEHKTEYNIDFGKDIPISKQSEPLKNYTPIELIDSISSTDIPNFSNREIENSHKFASLYNLFYHLEVSLRNYLRERLKKVWSNAWEENLKKAELIPHAFSLKRKVELNGYFQKRGNDVLNYCNWIDYGEILKMDNSIWDRRTSINEFVAHLQTMYKIRNAIAHNAENLPSEMFKELEVFVIKFIKIFK